MNRSTKILAVALIAVTAACGRGGNENPDRGPNGRLTGQGGMGRPGGASFTAIPVSVDTARIKPISAHISTTTTLEAEKNVEIVAKVPGVVKEILIEEGQVVRAGQALARLDDEEISIQVMEAKARADNAANVFKRSADIFEQHLISKEEYENAQYQMEIARTQLESAELRLKYSTIRSPIDGMVTERLIDHGAYVTTNSVVYRMADYDPILARVRIPEKEIKRIKLGQTALVEVEGAPNRQFGGKVDMISPIIDPQSGTVKVTMKIRERDGILAPGMFAKVYIVTDTRPNALVISKKALILEGDIDYVFLYEDGTAQRRQIKRGYEESNTVEVTSGLEPGDRVITVGAGGLRDGMAVYVPGETTPALAEAAAPRTQGRDINRGRRGRSVGSPDTEAAPPGGNPGADPPRISGGPPPGFKLDEERIKRIEARMLQNPEIKAAYEKKLKEDPQTAGDMQKRMALLRELASGRGRPDYSPGDDPPGGDRPDGITFDEERLKEFESSLLQDPEIKAAYDKKLKEDPELADDIHKRTAFFREIMRRRGGQRR